MELEDFVRITIFQICKGVSSAIDECKDLGAIVNPNVIEANGTSSLYIPVSPERNRVKRSVQTVDINADIMISETKDTGGKLGISIGGFGAGIGNSQADNTTYNNHVSFSVPVAFPVCDVTDGRAPEVYCNVGTKKR